MKIPAAFLIASVAFTPSHAKVTILDDAYKIMERDRVETTWSMEYKATYTFMEPREGKDAYKFFGLAHIANSKDGVSRIGFSLNSAADLCSGSEDNPEEVIVEFDGQPMKAILFCKDRDKSGGKSLQFIPKTEAAQQFLVKRLGMENKKYVFSYGSLSWTLSSNNFANVYKARAKDAL